MIDDNKTFNKRALTIKEAAEYACVSRGTMENWLNMRMLPYEEIPGRSNGTYRFRRIRKKDLDEFLNLHYRHKMKRYNDLSPVSRSILLPHTKKSANLKDA